jgi:hypothetical protein
VCMPRGAALPPLWCVCLVDTVVTEIMEGEAGHACRSNITRTLPRARAHPRPLVPPPVGHDICANQPWLAFALCTGRPGRGLNPTARRRGSQMGGAAGGSHLKNTRDAPRRNVSTTKCHLASAQPPKSTGHPLCRWNRGTTGDHNISIESMICGPWPCMLWVKATWRPRRHGVRGHAAATRPAEMRSPRATAVSSLFMRHHTRPSFAPCMTHSAAPSVLTGRPM